MLKYFFAGTSIILCLFARLVFGDEKLHHESFEPLVSAANFSLLWGPYRPNLYFGVKARIPESPMLGILWTNVDKLNKIRGNMLILYIYIYIYTAFIQNKC